MSNVTQITSNTTPAGAALAAFASTDSTYTPALLRLSTVMALVGVSKTTLYRWAREGLFPKPRALTPSRSSVAWSAAEVRAWIAGKLAEDGGTFDGTSEGSTLQAA